MISNIDKITQNFLHLIKKKDIKTYQHSIVVERYAMLFFKYLQLTKEEQIITCYAGGLHDIGKLFIPDSMLISNRCYKPAYSQEEALEIMDREKGKQFEPELLDKFFNFIQKENALIQEITIL